MSILHALKSKLDALKPKYGRSLDEEIAFLNSYEAGPDFDFSTYFPGFWARKFGPLVGAGLNGATWLALKTGWVNFRILPFKILAQKADVQAAFENNTVFKVPFGPEMGAIAGPEVFGLGRDDEDHTRQRQVMWDYMIANPDPPGSEMLEDIRRIARAVLDDGNGKIDVISEYAAPIISEICLKKFGLECRDPVAFAQWNIAISMQLFARPTGSSKDELKQLARAMMKVRNCIEASMAKPQPAETLLGYLQQRRAQNKEPIGGIDAADYLTDEKILAIVAGMVSGFIPTTTLASGNLLMALSKTHARFSALTEAAQSGDRARVQDVIMEAARFRPAGDPGHFRRVSEDFKFSISGVTSHKFKKGNLVLLSTQRAMSDKAARPNPKGFCPGHTASPNFMFGHDHHSCVGQSLATEVMTELFLALGAREGLMRPHNNKGVRSAGPFLWNMPFTYKPVHPTYQSMITIGIPLYKKDVQAVRDMLEGDAFSNPASRVWDKATRSYTEVRSEFAQALHDTRLVHNSSMGVLDLTRKEKPAPILLIELNVDGSPHDLYTAVEAQACAPFDALMKLVGKPDDLSLAQFLRRYQADLVQKPRGNIGLNFNGVGDFSTRQIELEHRLMSTVEPVLQGLINTHSSRLSSAGYAIKMFRSLMKGEDTYVPQLKALERPNADQKTPDEVIAELKDLSHTLYRPARRLPPLADHTEKTFYGFLLGYLLEGKTLFRISLLVIVPFLIAAFMTAFGIGASANGSQFVSIFASFTVLFVLLAMAFVGAFIGLLVRHEKADAEDKSITSPRKVREIESRENERGYAQTHMTAVNKLKPGRFRLAALSFGLWIIAQQVGRWFRSGFVIDIDTIRHAKWFRLAGTDYLIFQANFDGSWEAYLEDFSNKAYLGQNAAWSHCEGFPRTRLMSLDGARDADQFKRWVRGKQVVTPFWYSRFPEISNAQIRRNALIRDGLARACSDSEAQAWLSYFGSQPKMGSFLESDEVQSLVFNGQGELAYSACIGLRFNDDKSAEAFGKRQAFIKSLMPDQFAKLGDTIAKDATQIGFGDVRQSESAVYLALSSTGLAAFGLRKGVKNFELDSFSVAFDTGMGNRDRVLNDFEQHDPEHWDWWDARDTEDVSRNKRTDVMLFPMARSEAGLKKLIKKLEKQWDGCAKEVVRLMTGASLAKGEKTAVSKPFGFADGISQPVIKGSFRHSKPAPKHDVMEPGEFILGYKDNRDVFPPTPQIDASRDVDNRLPDLPAALPESYAAFGTGAEEARDLGRNGTYIALRQVELDTAGFDAHIKAQAKKLEKMVKTPVSEEYFAAKIVGRWRSGATLVRHPKSDPKTAEAALDNDFLYSAEDPQGMRCPLGSHVRRSNPRDSFGSDSETQLQISNRHRILRRGRSYHRVYLDGDTKAAAGVKANLMGDTPGKADSEGLLFLAINANLERQFEFVQQTWINGHSFHGLNDAADPLMASGTQKMFNIPTANGSLTIHDLKTFTRTRGGGYYFMPGRAMLRFLGGTWDGEMRGVGAPTE